MHRRVGQFLTEKQVESYLQRETRIVYNSKGKAYHITMFSGEWRSFEIVLNCDFWSSEEIVDLVETDRNAALAMKRTNKTFSEYFPDVVSYMHYRVNN